MDALKVKRGKLISNKSPKMNQKLVLGDDFALKDDQRGY